MIEKNVLKDLAVLYVEDDINFKEETSEILELYFGTVDLAVDGSDGLKKYKNYFKEHSSYYDIVISDISMPNIDGIEFSKRMFELNSTQFIVIISAHDESSHLLELLNMGIQQFLTKPLKYNDVVNCLSNISKKISSKNDTKTKGIIQLDDNKTWNKKLSLLLENDEIIKLTKKEILLMTLFIKNNTQITTYNEIFNTLWDNSTEVGSTEALLPIISRFRKKVPNNIIENIYGLGYRLLF